VAHLYLFLPFLPLTLFLIFSPLSWMANSIIGTFIFLGALWYSVRMMHQKEAEDRKKLLEIHQLSPVDLYELQGQLRDHGVSHEASTEATSYPKPLKIILETRDSNGVISKETAEKIQSMFDRNKLR